MTSSLLPTVKSHVRAVFVQPFLPKAFFRSATCFSGALNIPQDFTVLVYIRTQNLCVGSPNYSLFELNKIYLGPVQIVLTQVP